jgi:ATP-dependent RNA helicase DDX5/DBP2
MSSFVIPEDLSFVKEFLYIFLSDSHKNVFVLWHRNERDRSPDRGSSWSDRFKTVNRERSRSPAKAAPSQNAPVSFHQAMMQRNGGGGDRNKSFNRERSRSPSPYRQDRASSPGGGRSNNSPKKGWGGSSGDGRNGGYNGELEEGMIPDEEGMIGHDDSIYQSAN